MQRIQVCTIAKDTIIEIGQVSSDSIKTDTETRDYVYIWLDLTWLNDMSAAIIYRLLFFFQKIKIKKKIWNQFYWKKIADVRKMVGKKLKVEEV